mmetsp:Transcript_42/g.120  ORF Transcript_42/g.120 Transcript_42/m.120 type:complete len:325 (-) Transcript_42:568-1542(-)
MPLRKLFCLEGLGLRIQLKNSGEKDGMPSYWRRRPVVMVSPMEKAPGFTKPTMSPGYATSIVSRLWAKSLEGADRRTVLPVRVCSTCMSFSKRPEQTRTKAMRSRCRGSMLACSLKTKPVKSPSLGATSPRLLTRAPGGWESSRKRSRNCWTPKLLYPDPNHTGVCRCARTSAMSRGSTMLSRISSSSRNWARRSAEMRPSSWGSMMSSILVWVALLAPPAERSNSITVRSRRSYTPANRSPDPIGHVIGHGLILRVCSMVSSSSSGPRDGRSILLMKVKRGRWRSLTTSKSFSVCVSRPLAPSRSITALSAAAMVRYVSSLKS